MMSEIDLLKEFEKIEKRIADAVEKNQDVTPILHSKVRLLGLAHAKLADEMRNGRAKEIVPIFAKRMGLLNNMRELQLMINEDTSETDAEIKKVETRMRELGFGWILDNLPQPTEN